MDINQAEIDKSLFFIIQTLIFRCQSQTQQYFQITNLLRTNLSDNYQKNLKYLKYLSFFEPLNVKLEQDSDVPNEQQAQLVKYELDQGQEKKQQKQLKRTSKNRVYCKLCRKYFKDQLNLIRHQYYQHGINFILDHPENKDYKLFEEKDCENQIQNAFEKAELYNQIYPTQHKRNQKQKIVRKTFQKTVKVKNIRCNICSQCFYCYDGLLKHQVIFHDLNKDNLQFNKRIIPEVDEQNKNLEQGTQIMAKNDIQSYKISSQRRSNDFDIDEINNVIKLKQKEE